MINALSFIACVSTMTASVVCAFGKLKVLYMLGIINGCLFVLLNAAIASSGHQAVGLMIVPSVLMICTNSFGLWRLRKEACNVVGV
jgi:hypothetical protein